MRPCDQLVKFLSLCVRDGCVLHEYRLSGKFPYYLIRFGGLIVTPELDFMKFSQHGTTRRTLVNVGGRGGSRGW